VTFHNTENGFCVLRVKARGQRDLITVLGHAAMISAGEFVQASGTSVNDRTHGVQFRASFLKATAPTTIEGIEKYLGSGMLRGIGPVYAKKLVRAFGEAVFDVIEQEPPRLRQVTGIGPKRAERIIAGWAEQKVIREIMLFLHSNGVGTSRAVRIYKTYGADAVQLISENPYRLARDIRASASAPPTRSRASLASRKPRSFACVPASPSRSPRQWTMAIAAFRPRSSSSSLASCSRCRQSWSKPPSASNFKEAQ
jgi:exodeoxyribonuclease V alpha subunit